MAVQAVPGFDLQPSSEQVALASNYITNFDFLNQYLPDTYEKEFERYGNRTVASFLRLVGAEMPSNSDLIKWAEQGRLHTKYTAMTAAAGAANVLFNTYTVNDANVTGIALRAGQTVMLVNQAGNQSVKGLITAVPDTGGTGAGQVTISYYESGGQPWAGGTANITLFVYGSEFGKGTQGMVGSLEAEDVFFDNKPIIIKDKYAVSGSDMAQIGWVEVSTENGANGYLWYLKSEHETRLRFEDYLETAMLEAVPASPAVGGTPASALFGGATTGSEGIFHVVENRGNVWGGGSPQTLGDFDSIIQRLDKQGAIEENVIFLNRQFGFDVDDMLAAQNSYGAGGTSYGLFDNDEEMALNLGFSGFRRGYDFYKTDWKYLNDPTMRGGIDGAGVGINGLLVPAGSTSVYDQILGKNAKRPFLHVRYRASETEDRRYKTWITGSAGGARTSDLDAMEVNFLSERAVCTLGANNFFIMKD